MVLFELAGNGCGKVQLGFKVSVVFFDEFSMMGSVWCFVFLFSFDGNGSGNFYFNFCGNNVFFLIIIII